MSNPQYKKALHAYQNLNEQERADWLRDAGVTVDSGELMRLQRQVADLQDKFKRAKVDATAVFDQMTEHWEQLFNQAQDVTQAEWNILQPLIRLASIAAIMPDDVVALTVNLFLPDLQERGERYKTALMQCGADIVAKRQKITDLIDSNERLCLAVLDDPSNAQAIEALRQFAQTSDKLLPGIAEMYEQSRQAEAERAAQAQPKPTRDRAVNYPRAVVYRRLHEIEADPEYAGQHTKAASHYLDIISTMAGLGTELSPGDQAARRWLEEQKSKGKPYADNLSIVYLDKDRRLAGYEVGDLPTINFTE